MARKAKPPIAPGAQDTTCDCGTAESVSQARSSDPKLPPGTNHCLCSACGRYFGGVNGFERHRVKFQCVDPVTIGLELNPRGYWVRPAPKVAAVHGGEPIRGGVQARPPIGVLGKPV